MQNERLHRGKKGEQIVAHFFVSKGYRVVARNFFARVGEIDLIVENDDTRVFVEVKTKTDITHGEPHEQVDAQKLEKIIASAQIYNATHPLKNLLIRIDVVAVYLDESSRHARIRHFENVTA